MIRIHHLTRAAADSLIVVLDALDVAYSVSADPGGTVTVAYVAAMGA